MTTSSEDVLLSMPHVRYKKGDGTLYVMNQRIAWMVDNRDKVTVSHKYADIKSQKISPAGKPKVQLQVVLHDGQCSTFHFVNPAGIEVQQSDRDQVKQLLQNLLPKFKRQVDKELEEKSRLLSLHPNLKSLYEDLVISKVISSEEYWNTPTLRQYTDTQNVKQDVGVSCAFLADIQPQTDGCNGLKYNLTQDIMEAIFKTYPAVRRKHNEYVPDKMSEPEFWTKFFQSHYFHRDRLSHGSRDLFAECAKYDDNAMKTAVEKAVNSNDNQLIGLEIVPDSVDLVESEPPLSRKEKEKTGDLTVHTSMIKRFNQHSIMVLKASHKKQQQQNKIVENGNGSEPKVNGISHASNDEHTKKVEMVDEPKSKRRRLLDKIKLDDLEDKSDEKDKPQELQLSKIERYLVGPSGMSNEHSSKHHMISEHFTNICQDWCLNPKHRYMGVNGSYAVQALGELSPGGALMRDHHTTSMAQLIPQDIQTELQRLYLSCGELLRSLWRCFPQPGNTNSQQSSLTDEELQAKGLNFYEALLKFRNIKLRPFEEKMQRELSPLATTLTKHLNEMIDQALNKYNLWQQRSAKLR